MNILKNRVAAVATGALLIAGLSATGGAYASSLIGSEGIQNDSVRSIDLQDGYGVGVKDLKPGLLAKVNTHAEDGVDGVDGTDGVDGKDADMSRVEALEAAVAKLQADAASGSDINTNWVNGLGATILDANTVKLDSRNDDGYAYATIGNLDLPIQKGAVIEFTYKLADGAATGWGAPRIQIRVNGVTYSSAHQINPDYGHDNGDGTFTVSVPATSMNDNSATLVPEGTITRASLVYDYQDKGTVTFQNVVIDGQPISFK